MSTGSYGRRMITSHRTRLALVTLLATAAAAWAPPAAPANERRPPKIWEGAVSGTDLAVPSVGTTTTWTANVRFKLVGVDRRRRNFIYTGTGSATYTISGGNLCTSSGSATFPIAGQNEGALNVIRTRSGWKYGIEIVLLGEDFIGQVQCPDQPVEEETEYLPPPLMTDRRPRPAPRGLSSISGSYSEAGHYTTTWSFSGTPRPRRSGALAYAGIAE